MDTNSKRKTFIRNFYKDNFQFIIETEDESIFEDIQRFISFEDVPRTDVIYDVTKIYFKDKKELADEVKKISEKGKEIIIHGGTPEQHVFGKKIEKGNKKIYRIPLNDEYIFQSLQDNSYYLYGDNNGKEDNLYRIVREIYYRKSLALGRVALHSAAVSNSKGECILIPGEKAAGKTTLLCNFLASDKYNFIDNDRLLLEINPDGKLLAHSMSSTVNVGYGTMSICPERFKGVKISGYFKPTEKKRYSRNEFIEQVRCSANTSGLVKSILFPSIASGKKVKSRKCDETEKMDRISLSIEKFDNSEHPDWLGISNISEEQYKENIKKEDSKKTHITLVEDILKYVEEMQDEKIMKIFICDSTQSVFNSIIKKFDGVQDLEVLDVSHMSRKVIKHGTTDVPIEYYYTEISMKNVDKWYAIEYLIGKLNIEKNEVMTIGDNMNDKKMIEEAGLGVVMKGSTPVVTAVADFVTDDNNNEGVAKAIGKFILT